MAEHGILAKSWHLTKIMVSVTSVIYYCPYSLCVYVLQCTVVIGTDVFQCMLEAVTVHKAYQLQLITGSILA